MSVWHGHYFSVYDRLIVDVARNLPWRTNWSMDSTGWYVNVSYRGQKM